MRLCMLIEGWEKQNNTQFFLGRKYTINGWGCNNFFFFYFCCYLIINLLTLVEIERQMVWLRGEKRAFRKDSHYELSQETEK